ncbi:UDP-2,4-diacetamido-2,4,6-trideoxy-beta-L-altropyranose hydrolase [Qipengyuania flava]|nr:UDP-2,4-diacetamido-2,4,6-trideoxy-beta-L-altropyranose hydrolase [Qipengyuania flava]
MMDRASNRPLIVFRTDASLEIGTGHVMRCLTLADGLRERGARALFITREHRGHLVGQIVDRGHEVGVLPPPPDLRLTLDEETTHAAWLGVDWSEDARQTLNLLAGKRANWLVVDHYALDRRWEQTLRPTCEQLMVMDDLADRPHDCDVLLDPSLGRAAADYSNHIFTDADVLTGPDYALLRPEFADLRAESLKRREQPSLKHLLVTMGGVDRTNATASVLDAIDACSLPDNVKITVVLGPHAPWLADIEKRSESMRFRVSVRSAVIDMASLMTASDLAIGAAGSTSWERFCLGVPTLQFVLAENQIECARAFAERGAVIGFDLTQDFKTKFVSSVNELDAARLRSMAQSAAEICDGHGVQRVLEAMLVFGVR